MVLKSVLASIGRLLAAGCGGSENDGTSVAQFEDAVTDVEQDGDHKTIDGVETTPYHATVDADRAMESGAMDKDGGIRPGADLAYTFYIDADDLLRRMEFSFGGAKARMDVAGYGEPVDIVAPPADQVMDESTFDTLPDPVTPGRGDNLSASYASGMTISRKLSSIAATVLVAGLTLSACGGSDEPSNDTSTSKPDADGSGETTLTKANFAQAISESQTKAKSSHLDMTVGVGGQSIEAKGDVLVGSSAADTAMTMSMDMGSSMTMDMRLVDQVFYMNMGPMTDNKFAKIDLTDENNIFAKQYGQIVDQMDPAKQMEQFQEAMKSFEKKGEPKTLDGVEAQPYVVTVDTSKIKALADLEGAAASQIPDTIEYTMFIGPDNLPRRIETELAGSKTTMNYSKWGEPVDIKAPSADEISDKDLSQLGGVPTPAA